jgi:predicted component of type VI protein secretion system
MTAQAKLVVQNDPAGLDKLLLAAGKGIARYLEKMAQVKLGQPLNLWDGKDGLGAVLEEHLQAAGVPNKRLSELLTPRLALQNVAPKKRNARRLKAT